MDPELERILQDYKRLRNGFAALEDRLLTYLANNKTMSGSQTHLPSPSVGELVQSVPTLTPLGSRR